MSTAQAPQEKIAKRLQLSRDQKALLETVYAMEKLPQRQNPTGVMTNSRCGLYCTPLVRGGAGFPRRSPARADAPARSYPRGPRNSVPRRRKRLSAFEEIMPKRACAGEWRGAGAGGSPQHATFFANQQFRLKLSATAYSHS